MKIRLRYLSLLLPLVLIATPLYAATPKASAKCSKAGITSTYAGKKYTCIKSGKKLVWNKGVRLSVPKPFATPSPSPSPTQQGSGQGSGQGSETPASNTVLRIGMSCTKNGAYGFTGGSLSICKNGVVKYALPSDIPAAPVGGYTSKPDWYPSLAMQQGESEPSCSPQSIKFTSPVVPLDQMAPSVPYGDMVGDHVTPIDHMYIGIKSLYKTPSQRTEADYVPVTAIADGRIVAFSSLGSPTSLLVSISHGCNLWSLYMVLNKATGVLAPYANKLVGMQNVGINIPIKAGQEFGRQRDNSLDFAIFDGTSWLSGFANPYSYMGEAWKPYTADPLPFFTAEIRAAFEANLQRRATPQIGKIDHDIVGTASGTWFLDGTAGMSGILLTDYQNATTEIQHGTVVGKSHQAWNHLSIAPHAVDITRWIFSTGSWSTLTGDHKQAVFDFSAGQVTPNKLTVANGLVAYVLVTASPKEPAGSPARSLGTTAPFAVGYTLFQDPMAQVFGVVGLQVNKDGSLKVEINTTFTSAAQFTAFTSEVRSYHR